MVTPLDTSVNPDEDRDVDVDVDVKRLEGADADEAAETPAGNDACSDSEDATEMGPAEAFALMAGPPIAEETAWICEVLRIDPGDWTRVVADARPVAPWEIGSIMVAFETLEEVHQGEIDRGCFEDGFRTGGRFVHIPVGPGERKSVRSFGHAIAFEAITEHPVIARLESEPTQPDLVRLVVLSTDIDAAEAGQAAIRDHARGDATTWRRKINYFDPTPAGLSQPMAALVAPLPPPRVQDEVTRTIVRPLLDYDENRPRRSLLVSGPVGTGKSALIDWVTAQVCDHVTVVTLPPRISANPDLIHLAYDMAASDAPSLIILDHLDIFIGDRFTMRYPESLAELLAQLDDRVERRGVFTLATVTYPEALDGALKRRFHRWISLGAATAAARRTFFEGLATTLELNDLDQIDALTRRTDGWTFGQLSELSRLADDARRAAADDNIANSAGAEPLDVTALLGQVDKPVSMAEASDDGSYL